MKMINDIVTKLKRWHWTKTGMVQGDARYSYYGVHAVKMVVAESEHMLNQRNTKIKRLEKVVDRLNGRLQETLRVIEIADDALSMKHWIRAENVLHEVLKTNETPVMKDGEVDWDEVGKPTSPVEVTEPAWEAIRQFINESSNPLFHDFAKAITWLKHRADDERSRIILLGERLDHIKEQLSGGDMK